MRRIFIISNHIMFGHGLESLLRQETNFEILGQENDIDRAIEQIKRLEPEVVIFDNDSSPQNTMPNITRILTALPGVKVIGLSLEDNHINIYQATQWMAENVDDLVKAIEADPITSQ